jgi:hypothetical protein
LEDFEDRFSRGPALLAETIAIFGLNSVKTGNVVQ